jgi:tetratricopeptide (TPR) repeat protein
MLEQNIGQLPELVKWAGTTGIIGGISFLALLESGLVKNKEGWFRQPEYKHLWPQDHGKVQGVIDELIALKKQGYKIVNPLSQLEAFKEYYRDPEKFLRETEYCIHDYIIDLDPSSEILLSGHPLGHLENSRDLKELWFSEKANQIRRYIDEYGCDSSRSCLINFLCAFPPDGDDQLDHYGNLAFFYQVRGKYDQSLLHFKKALIRNPRNANLHLGVAYSYLRLKDYRVALDAYDRAFGLKPDLRKDASIMSDYQKALEGALKFYTQRRRDLYR